MTEERQLLVGIDVGSTTTKIAAARETDQELVYWEYRRHNASQAQSVIDGLERLAVIVGAHRDMTPVPPQELTERELVFLADKYCRGGDWVSVARRFADKLERYAGDAAACAAIEGRRERALRMEAALAEALRPLADRGEASHPADVARQALAGGAPAAHAGAERHAAGK